MTFKPGTNGIFTGMAKGRVANIMGQAGGLHNGANIMAADIVW